MICAQQAVMSARTIGGFTEVAQQGGRQNILDQSGFARTTHASNSDQALQRELYAQVLQIVLSRTFQNQAWRRVSHQTL